MVATAAKASSKIYSLPEKAAKNEQAIFQIIRKIKRGETTLEDIEQSLTGPWREAAVSLHEAYTEDGTEGYERSYRALMKGPEYAALRKWYNTVFDIPHYAGTLLSEVKPEKIDWLWKPRLALGKITMLDGDPGLGKSLLTADLAACITTGRPMPDGAPGIKGGVVLISPEDGLADTIQPRLARAGAALAKISFLGTIKSPEGNERGFKLSTDLPLLEKEIERVQARLVVIDPIMAVIGGGKNTYKDDEVRDMLMPLQKLVEKMHVSCILLRHLTKARGDNPLMAGNGSMAFIALARTGLLVIADPEIEGQTVLAQSKSNIGRIATKSLTYVVTSDEDQGDERPYIVWGETTDARVSDMLIAPRKNEGSNRQQILDLLKQHAPDEGREMTVQAMAEALPDITMGNLKMTLKRMYDKGEIGKSERGLYHAK